MRTVIMRAHFLGCCEASQGMMIWQWKCFSVAPARADEGIAKRIFKLVDCREQIAFARKGFRSGLLQTRS